MRSLLYATAWMVVSSAVIMYNKYILTVVPFPFPIGLTMLHMLMCTVVTRILVDFPSDAPKEPLISQDAYYSFIIPIGGLFAASLWFGNAAYVHLSVSFIQMVKVCLKLSMYVQCLILNESDKASARGDFVVRAPT